MRAITDETREVIIRTYKENIVPMWAVAKAVGVSVGFVHKVIHEAKQPVRSMKDYPVSEKTKRHMAEVHEQAKGRRLSEEHKKRLSEKKTVKGVGHRKHRSDGYIQIYFPDHPRSNADGYIMEHHLVMEAVMGRHLKDNECVHHINGIRNDNRKENLKVMTKSEHMSMHMKERHAKRRNDLSI